MKKVTHKGTLLISGIDIPCYVTDDGQRLLASRRLQVILKVTEETTSSGRQVPGKRMDRFFGQKSLKPLFDRVFDRTLLEPIRVKDEGKTIVGYDARLLSEICRTILEGRREGLLVGKRQKIIAYQCEILQSGFAQVGLISLIDEVTGYQEVRDKIALRKILDKYLLVEQAKWAKRFPDEFYELMFKLRGWQWKGMKVNRPSIVGKYTNDLVYERLAPGLLDELNHLNPPDEKGRRKSKHQQWLTEDIGHPELQKHLYMLIGFERASANWGMFYRMVQRALPKLNEQIPLALEE
ncbi:MAG TPA: P63C domain-containing protein [archaeon]|nr:P63C domain-containing protein [archaeon]